ncbi:MAG TPA: hypothetical protein VLA88_01755 [Candidatus Saccharimonadales bacterium]|nr:hypothetical protein [Candidatus Saccharimonadales bacterium]
MTADQLKDFANYVQFAAWILTVFGVAGVAALTRQVFPTVFMALACAFMSLSSMFLEVLAYTPPSGQLAQFSDRWMTHDQMLWINGPMLLFVMFMAAFVGYRPVVSNALRKALGVEDEHSSVPTTVA